MINLLVAIMMFCGTALDRLVNFLSLLLCIDYHAIHLRFGRG